MAKRAGQGEIRLHRGREGEKERRRLARITAVPRPFYSAIGKRRHNITDQSSVRPSAALATPSLQSSAPFSSRQSAQNHPLPTPPRDQFPIDGQYLAAVPRVRSLEAFGRRPSALTQVDCSRRAGIRIPTREPSPRLDELRRFDCARWGSQDVGNWHLPAVRVIGEFFRY